MEIIVLALASIVGLLGLVLLLIVGACTKGTTWNLVAGTRRIPENMKWRYQIRHFRIIMNRLIGMKVLLPLALLCIFLSLQILLETGWMSQVLLGALIFISSVSVILFVIYVVPKILNGIFYREFSLKDRERAEDCVTKSKKRVS